MWPLLASLLGVGGAAYIGIRHLTPWILEDIRFVRKFSISLKQYIKNSENNTFLIDLFESMVTQCPDKIMLLYENQSYTYEYINKQANQVAHTLLNQGIKVGDVVALMMHNEPQFIWIYLGLLKIGVQSAFINYNQRQKTLVHSIQTCEAKHLIIGDDKDLIHAVKEVQDELEDTQMFIYSMTTDIPSWTPMIPLLQNEKPSPVDILYRSGVKMKDPAIFIFTSGTTGLPKAAIVTQDKLIKGAYPMWSFGMCRDDILYEPLPLYHSAASVLGIGNVVSLGATMVLKRKFSASQYWDDCRRYKVTVIHYVGELCRYLVAKEPKDSDGDHCVKYAFGNGLRRDIWQQLRTRFKIPNVVEMYGATEMPIGFINLNNKVGAVGRASPLLKMKLPVEFVKYDMEEQDLIRDKKGFAIRTGFGEPGLLIIKYTNMKGLTFEGYKGRPDENIKKIFQNVFREGDKYINTGDLFIVDKDYDIFFNDRIGDTFRWKGENVSTTEVSNILGELDFIMDACVYGVLIPGCEGRAGMAAVVLKELKILTLTDNQLTAISNHVTGQLAGYAWPRFIRVQEELELTGTYKQRKMALINDGYDLEKVRTTVYYLDLKEQVYKTMDSEIQKAITDGKVSM